MWRWSYRWCQYTLIKHHNSPFLWVAVLRQVSLQRDFLSGDFFSFFFSFRPSRTIEPSVGFHCPLLESSGSPAIYSSFRTIDGAFLSRVFGVFCFYCKFWENYYPQNLKVKEGLLVVQRHNIYLKTSYCEK